MIKYQVALFLYLTAYRSEWISLHSASVISSFESLILLYTQYSTHTRDLACDKTYDHNSLNKAAKIFLLRMIC